MVLRSFELAAQLAQTEAFIATDPDVLNVSRTTRERVPGGGTRVGKPVSVGWRRVRMIPGSAQEVVTPAGQVVRIAYVLMALPTVDIQTGDEFEFNGESYQVHTVSVLDYELKAEVISRA